MQLSRLRIPGGLAVLLLTVALVALPACTSEEPPSSDEEASTPDEASGDALPDPFVLGFIPAERADEILPDARRLASFLEERLDVTVEVEVPASYEPLMEALRFGHVHAAFLDGGPAWIAHRRFGAAAQLAEVNDGETFYWGEAFVLQDSPISSLDDLGGRRVAFTSRTGSSGFIMPIGSLIREGIIEVEGDDLSALERAVQGFFSETIYAGGYRPALEALVEGRADVAFGAHDAPERFLSEEDRARLRTLHRFGRIPSHAVMTGGDLPDAAADRFREAMLSLNDPEHLPLLRDLYGVDGLEAVDTEEHLGPFGRALEALPGMDRTILEE